MDPMPLTYPAAAVRGSVPANALLSPTVYCGSRRIGPTGSSAGASNCREGDGGAYPRVPGLNFGSRAIFLRFREHVIDNPRIPLTIFRLFLIYNINLKNISRVRPFLGTKTGTRAISPDYGGFRPLCGPVRLDWGVSLPL